MRERFARWVFLMLSVALTLLGRPDAPCDHSPSHEESFRPAADDLSLMSEQRRSPGVRGGTDGERQFKPSVATAVAAEMLPRGALVRAAQFVDIEWLDAWSWRGSEPGFSEVSARGPPTLSA
jgi:hypothetical protein